MWPIVLIAAFPFIIGSVIKPLETMDETIWNNRIAEMILSTEDQSLKDKSPFSHSQYMVEDDIKGNYA